MDSTIRNLDPDLYRQAKAKAALTGNSIGMVINEALRAYLTGYRISPKTGSLANIRPIPFPGGNDRLSENMDEALYGSG